jgi:hypothetical protein
VMKMRRSSSLRAKCTPTAQSSATNSGRRVCAPGRDRLQRADLRETISVRIAGPAARSVLRSGEAARNRACAVCAERCMHHSEHKPHAPPALLVPYGRDELRVVYQETRISDWTMQAWARTNEHTGPISHSWEVRRRLIVG